jgi:YVTN family beta-propeller protein
MRVMLSKRLSTTHARPIMTAAALFAGATATTLAANETPALVAITETSFSRPHDVTLDARGRYLYVADLGNDVVKVLDAKSLRTVGEIGGGDLSSPHDVAFDSAGRLLVADSGNDRIAIYRVDGSKGSYIGELRGGLNSPEGVAPNGADKVYVTNAGGNNIVVFVGGKVHSSSGSSGRDAGQFIRPHDIEIGPDQIIYVADPGNNRIQFFDADLRSVGVLQQDFREPKYFGFDEKGWLYVADQMNHQVKIFDRERRQVARIGSGKAGRGQDQFNGLEGVVVRDGHIWIADTYNNRIVLYRWSHP